MVTLGVRVLDHLTPNGIIGQSNELFNGALGVAFVHDLERETLSYYVKSLKKQVATYLFPTNGTVIIEVSL